MAGDANVDALLRRVAKDETRHCRFFQLCLEALAENVTEAERAEIFPQFNALFKDHQMPQEHIHMFGEYDMGTDLYVKFWTPAHRSDLIIYLTHYFRQFRDPAWLEKRAAARKVERAAQPAALSS